MTPRPPRVYRQGASTYVIGTNDAHVACAALGITAETHQWGATLFGNFARRQGLWRAVNEFRPPKDCKPGVVFVGTIRQTDAEGDPHEVAARHLLAAVAMAREVTR